MLHEWVIPIIVAIVGTAIYEFLKHRFFPPSHKVRVIRVYPKSATQRFNRLLHIVFRDTEAHAPRRFFFRWLWRLPLITFVVTPIYQVIDAWANSRPLGTIPELLGGAFTSAGIVLWSLAWFPVPYTLVVVFLHRHFRGSSLWRRRRPTAIGTTPPSTAIGTTAIGTTPP
jgi:hypothetical protein